MKRTRLFVLAESFLASNLTPAERSELAAAVAADAGLRADFVEQVRMAGRLAAVLRPRAEGALWARIEPLLAPQDPARHERTADAVDTRIDREQRRPSRLAGGRRPVYVAGGVVAVLAVALLFVLRQHEAPTRERLADQPTPSGTDVVSSVGARVAGRSPPAGAGSPSVSSEAPLARPPAQADRPAGRVDDPRAAAARALRQEMADAEGPAFAGRADILIYAAFEGATMEASPVPWRGQPAVQLAPGLTGRGLQVSYRAGDAPSARFLLSTRSSALAAETPAPPAPDEIYLRFHMRLSADFDFGAGGILPGVCGGRCGASPRELDGIEAWAVRLGWSPGGELAFEQIPHASRARRAWRGRLRPGHWQVIELRVKLNRSGEADGLVEGWLDGEKVAAMTGLRLRSASTLHVEGVRFDTFLRGRGLAGPAQAVTATFDNLALATSYLGPAGRVR